MYTLAYRITNDFQIAEDVLQEAFIRIFANLGKFRQESSLGAWIKTIVVRTAITRIRKKIHFDPLEGQTVEGLIDWGGYIDVEYLEKAIHNLPEGYRTVFTLIEIEGFSHKEVAEMLAISEGTSKSQLFYAKRKLREALAPYI